MKNSSWIYKVIEDYKNSEETWVKELWELTEEYFKKHVLGLLVFHPLTEEDKKYILLIGFQNILYRYKAERSVDKNSGLLTAMDFEFKRKAALDKTNIDMKLFGAFHGFTFIASMDKYFLLDIYNKKKENLELTDKIKNYESASEDYEIDRRNLNNELWIAYKKIKIRAKKGIKGKNSSIRYTDLLRERTFENELRRIANATRKKNGKLNFSKIASMIGNISHHTIRNWCRKFKIPLESPYLTN